jgi:hypothetical protein
MPDPAGSTHKDTVLAARRSGRDPRPALLRLLVARYISGRGHSAAERQRFSDLAIRLFDVVDLPTAKRAATELATAPELPYSLALHLARGPIAIAAPVLRLSSALDEVTLMALTDTTTPDHAAAMSARREVSPLLAKKLAAVLHASRGLAMPRRERSSAPALPEPDLPALDFPAADVPAPDLVTSDLAPLAPPVEAVPFHATPSGFRAASAMQRAILFDQLALLPPLPMGARLPRAGEALLEKMELAAMRHQPDLLASLLEKALGVSAETAVGIFSDDSGEALVVVGRALGIPFDTVARLIFVLNPSLGRSVTRVFALADLHERLSEMSAQHLLAAWRGGRRAPALRMEELPSMRSFGQKRRRSEAPASETGERNRRGG